MSEQQQPDQNQPRSKSYVWLRRSMGFALCVALGILLGNSIIPRNGAQQNWRSVSEDSRSRRYGQFLGSIERVGEIGKNHETVKDAFRDVISGVRAGSVKVICEGEQVALGTVVDNAGNILTKASQLNGATKCKCKSASGDTFSVRVVGIDRELDLALLRGNENSLRPVKLAASAPEIGSWLAVPDPRGTTPLFVGTVSGRSRSIRQDDGFLGVLLAQDAEGIRIDHVLPESSAEKFGLLTGDVIISVDGTRYVDRHTLIQSVKRYMPGDVVRFGIVRDGQRMTRKITLTRRGEVAAAEDGSRQHEGGPLSRRRSGFPSVVQHDCPLMPHQCGGPLVNIDGEVVGINIARAGRVESFALPTNLVKQRLPRLMSGGN